MFSSAFWPSPPSRYAPHAASPRPLRTGFLCRTRRCVSWNLFEWTRTRRVFFHLAPFTQHGYFERTVSHISASAPGAEERPVKRPPGAAMDVRAAPGADQAAVTGDRGADPRTRVALAFLLHTRARSGRDTGQVCVELSRAPARRPPWWLCPVRFHQQRARAQGCPRARRTRRLRSEPGSSDGGLWHLSAVRFDFCNSS